MLNLLRLLRPLLRLPFLLWLRSLLLRLDLLGRLQFTLCLPLLLLPVFLEFRVVVHLLGDRLGRLAFQAVDSREDILRILEITVCQVILEFALPVEPDREAGVLTCIRRFEECEQSPGRDHAGSSRREEGEGHAGQRQDVHRTKHVQSCLENEQGRGRTGCYAVIC